MSGRNFTLTLSIVTILLAVRGNAFAHCDTMDGPLIQDAQKAIEQQSVKPALKWVSPANENIITDAFARAIKDPGKMQAFFEVLVKVHREGEGAEYTGVKPAGSPMEPGVKEADQALEKGSPEAVVKLIQAKVKEQITTRFRRVNETKKHKDHSIEAGRKFVAAYVDYVHYIENLAKPAQADSHGAEHHGHKGE